MRVMSDLDLLFHAARVDPVLRAAVERVRGELELRREQLSSADEVEASLRRANHRLMRLNGALRGLAADEPDDHWCAVEGCQVAPDYYDLRSDEFVCERHVFYDSEPSDGRDLRGGILL